MLPDVGMYDTILILDRGLVRCHAGHEVRELQTKDFDCLVTTYLVANGKLLCVTETVPSDEWRGGWRVEHGVAIHEERHATEPVTTRHTIRAYGRCRDCAPILVRSDGSGFPLTLVQEHSVEVDFELVVRAGEPLQIVRTSGSRDEQKEELLRRGLRVLGDDEQLAVVHREVKDVKKAAGAKGHSRRA